MMDNRDKIVDILVQCSMMIHDNRSYFEGKSFNEVGDWIRLQLTKCGYPCYPVGVLHVKMAKEAW